MKKLFGSCKKIIIFSTVLILAMALLLFGCDGALNRNNEAESTDEVDGVEENLIVVGFSQLGAESDWRSANTESMKSVFTKENGFKLIFEDAQQKQTNQITAIRSFIQQEVDYIVLAPVTETGWDTVLLEAKEAGIPVIIVDRMVDVSNEDLFTCWVGSDFELEGRKVCEWINRFCIKKHIPASSVKIVDIQGTLGSSAQIGRTKGFESAALNYGWNVVGYRLGDFTQTKGREAMFDVLHNYTGVNVVYCENDNEALGVIEVLEDSGFALGDDIQNGEVMIVSFDGVNAEALANLADGKISCIGECNPLSGPRVLAIIEALEAGGSVEKYEYVDESIFSSNEVVESVTVDGVDYPVTIVTH